MRAADTNVVVRILTRDTPEQAEAADRFIACGAWVSIPALLEAMWVLASVYKVPRSGVETAIEMLLAHTALEIDDPEIVREALQTFQEKPAIQFADALILAMARRAGHLPLGTFDRKLASRKGTVRL